MNTREKLIKDNVHGYIYVNVNYFDIIDTAEFQRLKNIKQTSYVSLYPSSTHDRFIHSLGTYYLGKQVIQNIINNLDDDVNNLFDENEKKSIIYTFEIACLLHDVGHAPFSHTGESFYSVKKMDDTIIHKSECEKYAHQNKIGNFCYLDAALIDELYDIYGSYKDGEINTIQIYMKDIVDVLREGTAKPHEKMSALLSLKKLREKIYDIGKKITGIEVAFNADLFVRCIIGARYTQLSILRDSKLSQKYTFYNAIVSLLNSDVIDVDKLDYILRDNFMTGYENTGIDIERLIKSFSIVKKDDNCILVYKKNALSVIENVIRASDLTRRWVQNHPIILYDTYITKRCISEAFKIIECKRHDKKVFENFFSIDTLTFEGNEWADGEYTFLASDLDVIALIKKASMICEDEEIKALFTEFFTRNKRRHPLWKSEAEYKICFDFSKIQNRNNILLEKIQSIISGAMVSINSLKDETTGVGEYIFNEANYDVMMERLPNDAAIFIKTLHEYFRKIDKPMDIVLLTIDGYASKILNTSKIDMLMPDYNSQLSNNIVKYSDLFDVGNSSTGKQMFYMYSKQPIDVKEFVEYLYKEGKYE